MGVRALVLRDSQFVVCWPGWRGKECACLFVRVRVRVRVCVCVSDSEKAHVGTSSLLGKKFQKEASWKLFQEVSI